MTDHRSKEELLAENEALYAELEDIQDRLAEVLETEDNESSEEDDDDDSD